MWKRHSAIGALAYPRCGSRPRIFVRTHEHTVRMPEAVAFLEHLHRFVEGPVVLIWDRLNVHRSGVVRDWVAEHTDWIQTAFLPAYAPELNPVEGLWSWVKQGMANLAARHIDDVTRRLRAAIRRARARPTLLRGFLAKTGLSI